jgi:hypothetical protein
LLLVSETVFNTADGRSHPSRAFRWTGPAILDACTVDASFGHLLVLTADGALHGVDLDAQASVHLCTITLPAIAEEDRTRGFNVPMHRLHASHDGSHAAVVVDQGQNGVVVKTQAGTPTMQLHGGDYHEETVPFSACFVRCGGRDVFVHRIAWNHLDVADPATGKSLTERSFADDASGDEAPAHEVDYFHGQLLPSPDGGLIYDDGWVWHPVSMPRLWSVQKWLTENPWESDDGDSIVDLAMRADWGLPACWVDEQRIAMWGEGPWYEEAGEEVERGAGVRVFDVAGARPSLSAWLPTDGIECVFELFSDGEHLFIANDLGTVARDIASRVQVAEFPGFTARLFHRSRRVLVSFEPDAIRYVDLAG